MKTETSTKGLASHAAQGALITISSQAARIVILALSTIVLARLLSPADFGLLAIVLAIIGFGEIFRDFGLSQAAIQAKSLSNAQRSNLFWVNTGIGLFLSAVLALLARPLATFVDDDRVTLVALVLSPTFLLNGLATQYRADLTRNLKFGLLAASDLVPAGLALAGAIVAALSGWGYWALVINQMGIALLSVCILPFLSRWLPRGWTRQTPLKPLLAYGGNLLGVQTMVYISRNIDRVIIAGSMGVSQLGVYDRAYQLLMMPLNQINAPANRVALPVLSRITDETRYSAYLVRGQKVVLHLMSAIFGFGTATASFLIPLILGNQWQSAAPIFQAFALAGFAQAAGYVTFWVFLSKGLTKSNFWYTLSTRPIMIFAVLLGSSWGAVGIAWSYSIVLLAMWPLGIFWVRRLTPVPAKKLMGTGLRCLAVYSAAATAVGAFVIFGPNLEVPYLLAASALIYLCVLVALYLVYSGYRRDVKDLLSIRHLIQRG